MRAASNGIDLQSVAVALLGPQCFSAGVIAGIGVDLISSAADLIKLVGTFVLADLHDIRTGQVSGWQLVDPTIATRVLVAKLAGIAFEEDLRKAAGERNALVKELTDALQDPKALFEGLADGVAEGYKKDWKDFNAHRNTGTLAGQFRAGMILGQVLVDVLGLITGIVGVGKAGATVTTKLPRLVKYARSVKLKPRTPRMPRTGGGAGGGRGGAPEAPPKPVPARTQPAPKAARPESPPAEPPATKPPEPQPKPVSAIDLRRAENAKLRESPRFPEDMKKAGVTEEQIALMSTKEVPLGFKNRQQFQQFKQELDAALRKDGLNDADMGMKGTATTFYSENIYNPNKPLGYHWDADPIHLGDYDLNITSTKMAEQMKAAGITPSEKTGLFKTRHIEAQYPELRRFAKKWSQELGRDVNVVGYPKPQGRDPTEFILRTGK